MRVERSKEVSSLHVLLLMAPNVDRAPYKDTAGLFGVADLIVHVMTCDFDQQRAPSSFYASFHRVSRSSSALHTRDLSNYPRCT